MTFLEAVNKQARYDVCIQRLKALEQEANEVNSGQKAKSKVGVMSFEVKMQQAMCT